MLKMINRNKLKKTILRIIKILFIIICVIFILFFIITKFFSEEIENEILKKLKDKINTAVTLENIELTLYDNFPKGSVRISNLLIKEPKGFENDTLIFSKTAYVEISLIDLINRNYNFESIIISDGKINIKYNDQNFPNYHVFKKESSNTKKSNINIKKLSLLNTSLQIKKPNKLNLNWDLEKAIVLINNKEKYNVTTNGISKNLKIDSTEYMFNKKFDFSTNTSLNKKQIAISNLNFQIEETNLKLSGKIIDYDSLDLMVVGKKENIKNLISVLPENIKKLFIPFNIDGIITFNSRITGNFSKQNNPYFNMNYNIKNGSFKKHSNPFILNQISMSGSANNGTEKSFNTTEITANNFMGKLKNGYVNGDFSLSNLNDYFLDASFQSLWDINELNKYSNKTNFVSTKGKLYTESNYKGNIAFDYRLKKMFLNANHTSKIKLEDVEFFYKEFPLKFSFKNIDCKITNEICNVKSSSLTISETDIDFNGEIKNLIGYILEIKPKIFVNGSTKSIYTNFKELMTLSEINSKSTTKPKNKTSSKIMPEWITSNTSIKIDNFSYDNIIASNISGNLAYNNGVTNFKNINGEILDGNILGEFILKETKPNNLNLKANINVSKINIRNSFNAFNNYGQEFILPENIKGIGSAKLSVDASWGPRYILNTKNLKINSYLSIEKGELIDFKPLESLSGYVSLDELKHVRFSNLENSIEVENELVKIPAMEIKSSALSVYISGTHSFNNEIDYNVTLLLSELLSSKFRQKNTTIKEFGEEKKDGKILNTVYFNMKGDTENPKITLDKIRFLEDIKKTIEKEKTIIRNIYDQEILNKPDDNSNDDEIDIEWEPEFK